MNDITKDTIGALALMGFLLFLYYLYNWKCVEYETESPVDGNTRRNTRTSTVWTWTSLSKKESVFQAVERTSSNFNKTVLTLVPIFVSGVLCLIFTVYKINYNFSSSWFLIVKHYSLGLIHMSFDTLEHSEI